MKILMLIKWSYRYLELHWQLSLEWLSYFEHTIQSLLNTCVFNIHFWSHTKPYICHSNVGVLKKWKLETKWGLSTLFIHEVVIMAWDTLEIMRTQIPSTLLGPTLIKVCHNGVTRYLSLESLTPLWIVIMLCFELYWGLQSRLSTIIDVVITFDSWFMISVDNWASNPSHYGIKGIHSV